MSIDIEQVRAMLRSLRGRPWRVQRRKTVIAHEGDTVAFCDAPKDAAFIAAAPLLVASALDEIEALQAQVARLEAQVARLQAQPTAQATEPLQLTGS